MFNARMCILVFISSKRSVGLIIQQYYCKYIIIVSKSAATDIFFIP